MSSLKHLSWIGSEKEPTLKFLPSPESLGDTLDLSKAFCVYFVHVYNNHTNTDPMRTFRENIESMYYFIDSSATKT